MKQSEIKTKCKLTYLEKQILIAISETHPHSLSECKKIYRICKSFDRTIKILEHSLSYDIDTLVMADMWQKLAEINREEV